MDRVVEKAFKSLAIACNTSALHPTDEDRVKVTLKALYKNGITISLNELEEYLTQNNWASTPTKLIIKWATAISTGGRVQLKNKSFALSEKQVWKKLNA